MSQEKFNPDGPFLFRTPIKLASLRTGNVDSSWPAMNLPNHASALATEIFPEQVSSMLNSQNATQGTMTEHSLQNVNDVAMVDDDEPNVHPCPDTMVTTRNCRHSETDIEMPYFQKCGNGLQGVNAEGWGNCFAGMSLEVWKCAVCYTSNPNNTKSCASCKAPHV